MISKLFSFLACRRGTCGRLPVVAALVFAVSCVGGPDTKKADEPAREQPVQAQTAPTSAVSDAAAGTVLTPQQGKEIEPSLKPRIDFVPPKPESALVAPVPAMPPVPGERSEKDYLADADRRSEVLKPMMLASIAAVVPGPYPEVKKPEPPPAAKVASTPAAQPKAAPKPGVKAPGAAHASTQAAAPVPTPAAPRPEPVPAEPPPQRAKPAVVTQAESVPDLVLEKKFTVADGLPSNLISALYVDESEAWVGTAGAGVARYIFAESHWIVTGTSGGLGSDFVTDIIKFKGKVYVGTKSGISVWDGFDWSSMSEMESVQLGNVSFTVKEGELWVAARNMRGGMLMFDGNKWTDRSTMRQGLILNNVSDFAFDNGEIWIGTTSRGVYTKRGKDWTIFSVTDGIASNFIYTMAVKGGKCYLGGCCGVSYYDGEKWTIYDVPEGLPHSTVNSIVWDATGIVWLGSKNGLSGFDGTSFRNFFVDDGLLPDNHVTSLFVKGDDVWVGTVGGLSHLKKSQ